jgi:trehalose 6-phosphate synthase
VQAGVFPVGIDVDEVQAMVASPEAQALMARLRQELGGRPQVLGVDRLDYSKGLPERLRAFRVLLDKYPDLRGQVTMLQIAAPSRTDVKAYADIRSELASLAGTINGELSQLDWTPIRHLTRSVSRTRGAALCRLSKVGLVTPLRDGMNLVAKEYVSAQDPDDPGVLVLSRFAGAAERLTAAVLVNPYDVEQMADALHGALRMPLEERRERHADLLRVVETENVHWWMDQFCSALQPAEAATLT